MAKRATKPHRKNAPPAKAATSSKPRNKSAPPSSKLDQIVAALRSPKGASIGQLAKLTGWQVHSVRGALAGSLKKRGLRITSTKDDDERIYRIEGGK